MFIILTKRSVSKIKSNKHNIVLNQKIWSKQSIVSHATIPTTGVNPYHNSFASFLVQNWGINIEKKTILLTD